MKSTRVVKNDVMPIKNTETLESKIHCKGSKEQKLLKNVQRAQSSMLSTFDIMSFPCNALVGVHPPITIHVIVHPFFIIPHFSPMNVGDHLLNSFLGYLFDGEEKTNVASLVEETKALELGFSKEDVVGKE